MDFSDLSAFAERATSGCPAPFLNVDDFADSKGYIKGRLCSAITNTTTCCLPCPLTDWAYPDSYKTLGTAAEWVAVVGTICCVFLLVSWAVLPVEKTARHYLSICLTSAVLIMSLGFVVPLAGQPKMCYDDITPNGMKSSSVCGASGTFLILGGWCGIMWVFLRSLSLHLQICWQVVVGRSFMWFSHVAGWGIPILGTTLAVVYSGVSFRFGAQCHINHDHSLGDLWIPLLVFAGLTIVVQLVTFAYCIKVYLASLADNSASTEGSGLPSYSNSIRTMTPRQAYRRVRRVIQLQWRGIAIVLIIVCDVIFFSIVFVFQDSVVANLSKDISTATPWLTCLITSGGDKTQCLHEAAKFSIKEATVGAVLILLAMNGLWLLFLLGRWSMVLGWIDLVTPASRRVNKREFVSVDARLDDLKKDTRSYEMLSRGASSAGHSITKDSGVVTSRITSTGATAAVTALGRSPGSGRSPTPLTSMGSSLGGMHSHDMDNGPVDGYGAYGAFGQSVTQTYHHSNNNSNNNSKHSSHDIENKYGADSIANDNPVAYYTQSPTSDPTAPHNSGRRTPDFFGQTARYNAPARSFSNPRPPTGHSSDAAGSWDARDTYASSTYAASPPRHGANVMQSHVELDDDDDTYGDAARKQYSGNQQLGANRL